MKGQAVHIDLVLKCGKYRKESYTDLTIKDSIEMINLFFKNELEIPTKISYNTIINLLLNNRPKNKLLSNFISVKKHI